MNVRTAGEVSTPLPITATLVFGATTFVCEGALAVWGLVSMWQGSDIAALVAMWLGLPLVIFTFGAFVIEAIVRRRPGRTAWWSRALGIALAAISVPAWYLFSAVVITVLHLG